MELRALTPIKKDQTIHVSYIDIYQTKLKRSNDLLHSKFFKCTCNRCQQPYDNDQYIDGILCNTCNQTILTQQQQPEKKEEKKKRKKDRKLRIKIFIVNYVKKVFNHRLLINLMIKLMNYIT